MSELNDAIKKSSWQLGKICQICGNGFAIYDIKDPRMVCPECCRRLKNLLYPEVSNDD